MTHILTQLTFSEVSPTWTFYVSVSAGLVLAAIPFVVRLLVLRRRDTGRKKDTH